MRPGIQSKRGQDVAMGQMVLEARALCGRQRNRSSTVNMPNEPALGIAGHAGAQDEVVHPATDINGINLDETQALDDSSDTGHGLVQQQGTAMKPASLET